MSIFDSGDDASYGACVDMSDTVGAVTGGIYTEIGGPAVGGIVGNFVTDGWASVCDLPSIAAESLGYGDNGHTTDSMATTDTGE